MPIAAWLADLVVIAHALFIVFVVAGGLLVLRWPRVAWVHLPAAVWGVLIEWAGWICPLTPLENTLRRAAGQAGYSGGCGGPGVGRGGRWAGLPPAVQLGVGLVVRVLNVAFFALWWRRRPHH